MIPFAKPDINQSDIDVVASVVRSGWLTTGSYCQALENALEYHTGHFAAHVTSSLTAAVAPLIHAMALGHRGRAVFPAWTFSSVPMEFRHMGWDVEFVDVDPETLMMPATKYRSADMLVPTHFAGNPYPLETLAGLNDGVMLVDDAAHLIPGSQSSFADATLYSFYATKPVAAGEGGAMVTSLIDMAERFQHARLHGFTKTAFDRYNKPQTTAELYDITDKGWKANMSDMHAALALNQMGRAWKMAARRSEIYQRYCKLSMHLPFAMLGHVDDSSFHLAVAFLNDGIDREAVIRGLAAEGVSTSVHFRPLYRFEFWSNYLFRHHTFGPGQYDQVVRDRFPVCEALYPRTLSLPLSSAMSDDDVSQVEEAITKVMRGFM